MDSKIFFYAVAISSFFALAVFTLADPAKNIDIALFVLTCSIILGTFIIFMRRMSGRLFPESEKTRTALNGTLVAAVALATPFAAMRVIDLRKVGIGNPLTPFALLFVVFLVATAFILKRVKIA
jgi:hypothetical protein